MMRLTAKGDWLERISSAMEWDGVAVVEGVLEQALLGRLRMAMFKAGLGIEQEIGKERLEAAGELGVLRLMFKYDQTFYKLLELQEVLSVVDHLLGNCAILHVQNGLMLPSGAGGVFQTKLHQDFKRDVGLVSINTLFAVDDFTSENGATMVIPGSHIMGKGGVPVSVECPAGSMIVFDSRLWHCAGVNTSGKPRLGINQQFTASWIKQQLDYCRALDVSGLKPRTQQLLGYYTRVPANLDEFYRPEEERLYRRAQG